MIKLYKFPLQPTVFVGRVDEVEEIRRLLVEPTCRLLTLIGPGGIGKTSLSTKAVSQNTGRFGDGCYFVPLQAVQSLEFLLSAIVDALEVPLTGQASTFSQLIKIISKTKRCCSY